DQNTYFVNVNGTAYFSATNATYGRELWKTDGTPEGTMLVADILPGTSGSFPVGLSSVNGQVFFTANDGQHGNEMWRSAGTLATTRLIRDINPSTDPSTPIGATGFRDINGTLFFTGDDGATGAEPWVLEQQIGFEPLSVDHFEGDSGTVA